MTLQQSDIGTNAPSEAATVPAPPAALLPPMDLAIFTESARFAGLMADLAKSRQFGRVRFSTQTGGIDAALAAYASVAPPHVLLIETTLTAEPLLTALDRLSELCDPDTRVLIVGGENDILLYRELLRRGISDYLPQPVAAEQVLKSLSDLSSASPASAKGLLTACLGASGGAGSSTVALNLAWLMGQATHSATGLIDLDLDFGTAGLSLALDGARGVAEALKAGTNLDGQLLDGLFDNYDENLRVLVAADTHGLAASPDPELLDHLTDLARLGGQRVVLDLPSLDHAVTRQALLGADRVVVTTTPDLAGLRNCRKIIDLVAGLRPDDPKPLVVLNKVGLSKRTEIAPREFAQTLGIALAATLPFDAKGFSHSANLGRVHVATRPGRAIATALAPLLVALDGKAATAKPQAKAKPASLLQRLFAKG